jgi:protein phosphatase
MPDEAPEIEAHGLTDPGSVRQDNQDAIRLSPADDGLAVRHGHLYGIADGMGGFAHGGIASALALEVLFKTFYGLEGTPPHRLRKSVQDANLGIYQMAARMGAGRMGTTLTAVHLSGHTLHVAHVGDSRAYLVRGHQATCLTQDHTRVGELVRMRLLSPDKVRGHHQRSVLDKCLGLELFVQPDIFAVQVRPGDRIVLCTDGVWGFVEDQDLARIAAAEPSLEGFNQAVMDAAIRTGSDDNLSLLTLRFRSLAGSPGEGGDAGLRGLIRRLIRR